MYNPVHVSRMISSTSTKCLSERPRRSDDHTAIILKSRRIAVTQAVQPVYPCSMRGMAVATLTVKVPP